MEIDNLTYKDQLKNICYNFTGDKIYGIIGNSENITLLMELIRGLKKPTNGVIKTQDSKVFMLFENSEDQIVGESIKENVIYGLDEDSIDLEEIANKLELDDNFWNKNPLKLSAGETRKMIIASMLAFNPDIVLIDNFLNLLDYETKKKFVNFLKRMQFDEHKIIIITDQDINALYELADEMILLTDEIVVSGSKYKVFENAELLSELDVEIPNYILFSNLVSLKKNVDLPYRDRITDVVKDVYDNVK